MKSQRLQLSILTALLLALPLHRALSQEAASRSSGAETARRVERAQHAKEKWDSLPAEEKEKILERYREWKRMAAEEKRRLHENLERLHKLPQHDREKLLTNLKRFEDMPPE